MTDDQGWGDFSSNGNKHLETPHFDQLAQEGVSLSNFFVSPVCAPTRASVLTGRYHLRTGVSWVTRGRENMRASETTLAEVLKSNGYRTGIFGKWHNGAHYPMNPKGQGFDEFLGFTSGHWSNYFDTPLQYNSETIPTQGYITDVLTDSAISFINKNTDQPFFCYVPYNAPHTPFQVPDEYFIKFKGNDFGYGEVHNNKIATIYAMCENIDHNFGRLLNTLKENKLEENTIVVFLSDNGPHGERYNGDMRGGKAQVHEGGVKVPCVIAWKGQLQTVEIPEITSHIDLMPTLLSLAGIETENELNFDGIDLKKALKKEETLEDRQIFTHMAGFEVTKDRGSVRTEQFRWVYEFGDSALYDMKNDLSETTNVIDKYPDVNQKLSKAYNDWFQDVTAKGFDELSIPVGYDENPISILSAHEAEIHGNMQYKASKNGWAHDWVVNWSSENDYASWPIEVVQEGEYEIYLQYTCPVNQVGSTINVKIGDQSIKKRMDTPFIPKVTHLQDRVKREQEAGDQTWGTLKIGSLQLKKGKQQLIVNAESIPNKTVGELKGLILQLRIEN